MSFKNTTIGLGVALGFAAAGASALYGLNKGAIALGRVEEKIMFNNDPDKFECKKNQVLDFKNDYLASKSIKCDDGRNITYAPRSLAHMEPSKLTVHGDGRSYAQSMTLIPGYMRLKTHLKEILSFM